MKIDKCLKRGISLITLVITIIIILILSSAILITTLHNNPIKKANEAKYKNDVDYIQSLLTSAVSTITVDTQCTVVVVPGKFNKVSDGVKSSIGEINYEIDDPFDSKKNGKIIFDESKKGVEGLTYYISNNLPIYGAGVTNWYVDKKANVSLKVGKNEIGNIPQPLPSIDTNKSFVGCYADFEGDGNIDGIIFADKAMGKNDQWINLDGKYTIPKVNNGLKEYYIKEKKIEPKWDENNAKDVIVPKSNIAESENLKERFYVMSLEDVGSNTYNWYKNAYGNMIDYDTRTIGDFEMGKKETVSMVSLGKLNGIDKNSDPNVDYGILNDYDLWKVIQSQLGGTNENPKWFVPSVAEWAAFANELKISSDSNSPDFYNKHHLNGFYWASSQYDTESAYIASFDRGCISYGNVNSPNYVRLASTF